MLVPEKDEKETYGFRSNNCPPAVEELAEYELDLVKMINITEFRSVRNNFFIKIEK